jgi:hypothetical protein
MTYDAIFFTEITDTIGGAIPTIGAYKCAHVLRKHGYKCLVVRQYGWYNLDELKELMNAAIGPNTRMLGFSTTFLRQRSWTETQGYQYRDMSNDCVFPQGKQFEDEFINYCRTFNSNLKFVAGGSGVTENWQNKNINYAFIGFSETSMVNLMDHLANKSDLRHNRKNIWGVNIIDDRLAPEYEFRFDCMQWLPEDVVNVKVLPIEIGRGCIFRCRFCSFPLNGKKNLDFVKLPEILREEMLENYQNYGIRDYQIVDDTFNDHVEKLQALANMIKGLPFQPRFWAYTRLDLICTRPETLPMLNDIGLRALYFGIETLNLKTGRIVGKGFDRQRQIDMIYHIRKNYPDMFLHGSFIAGLPDEPVESMRTTYRMLLSQDIPLHSWHTRALSIYLRTGFPSDMDQNWQKYGYRDLGKNSTFGNLLPDHLLNWANEHTCLEEMTELSQQVMTESYTGEIMNLSGQMAMSIAALNGDDFDFVKNAQNKQSQINFGRIEKGFFQHLDEYKQQLLQIVQQH